MPVWLNDVAGGLSVPKNTSYPVAVAAAGQERVAVCDTSVAPLAGAVGADTHGGGAGGDQRKKRREPSAALVKFVIPELNAKVVVVQVVLAALVGVAVMVATRKDVVEVLLVEIATLRDVELVALLCMVPYTYSTEPFDSYKRTCKLQAVPVDP